LKDGRVVFSNNTTVDERGAAAANVDQKSQVEIKSKAAGEKSKKAVAAAVANTNNGEKSKKAGQKSKARSEPAKSDFIKFLHLQLTNKQVFFTD